MKDLKEVLAGINRATTRPSWGRGAGRRRRRGARTGRTDVLAASMPARGRQANLSFFAFTATPKPKTLELFGELEARPGR